MAVRACHVSSPVVLNPTCAGAEGAASQAVPPQAWWVRWEAGEPGSAKRNTSSGARLWEFKSHLVTHWTAVQLGHLMGKVGLTTHLTELLGVLNDINGVKYSAQWLNKYKLVLLVTTKMTERQKNQKSKILDSLRHRMWWESPEAFCFGNSYEIQRNKKQTTHCFLNRSKLGSMIYYLMHLI